MMPEVHIIAHFSDMISNKSIHYLILVFSFFFSALKNQNNLSYCFSTYTKMYTHIQIYTFKKPYNWAFSEFYFYYIPPRIK